MKAIFTFFLILISLISFSQVRISQVYGGGGNPAASYTNDFVELFNAGTTTVDISNWSVQYASATGPVAPGNWAVAGIPAATTIAAGKYFLIALGSGGAVGIGLPTPDLTNNAINISNATGKVALVNNTTALNGTTACSGVSVVDVIGYGASPSCFETATAVTTGIDNTMSQLRGSAGCTDTNDNSSDFSIGTVNPRNSASAVNSCGPASATLFATPNTLIITGKVGNISPERTFTLSGSNLTGFPGNINLSTTPGLEVSLTGGAGFATSLNVPYTSATLLATTIYVHFTAAVPQGTFTGTVTCSGGSAANAVVTITGGAIQNYYNTKASNGLNDVSTWSSTPDGLGISPVNFIMAYQLFNVINQSNATYSGVWGVTGLNNSSRVVIGDGVDPISLVIPPGADSITMATGVDVLNNATLTIQNNRRPFLNNLATGSTVDFAQTGVSSSDTIRIPNISFYNLKLTGGLKYFSPAVTTIRGDLTADGVVSMNGSTGVFSTINAMGDVSFINNAQFEPLPSGDAGRITLAMNGSGIQTITGDEISLFRLQRDSITSNSNIILDADIRLGNLAGGGLRLNQGPSTSTVLSIPASGREFRLTGGAVVTPTSLGKINAGALSLLVMRSSNNTNAGILRFTSGSHFTGFGMSGNPAFPTDTIRVADSIYVEYFGLNKGIIKMFPGTCLTVGDGFLLAGGHILGGSVNSFVEGKLRQSGLIADTKFPVGRADKYAPVDILTLSADITVEYFFNDFGNHTIDPATLSTYPDYNISYHEYWVIDENNGFATIPDPDITFHYTDVRSGILDPAQVKIAHFDGTDWDDLGGTADAANTTSIGFVTVTGVSTFSPFTFSARTTGVLPVRLTSFTAQKQEKAVKLNWSTSQEINSSHFVVQRSIDGRTWKDIATVTAAGNSNTKMNYTTTDNEPVKGINFYRLKQVDINGNFDLSETRAVLFSSSFDVSINPNPATDFVNVFISKDNNNPSTIILTDMNGRQMKKYITSETTYKINASLFAPGVYFVRVVNDGNEVVRKLVVY